MAIRPPDDYVPYGARRPYVVADNLDDLRGPTHGTVTLPHHLDWSGSASYDMDRPTRLASMYKIVLNSAITVDDLNTWLDKRILAEIWPSLWLPPRLRLMWEHRFPELTTTRNAAA